MNIAFRVDASIEIGTGHVMRCLTLANALRKEEKNCFFICRQHQGNLIEFIQLQGFKVYELPRYLNEKHSQNNFNIANFPSLSSWLGTNWQNDACETKKILQEICVDWLIVDHYALDRNWENKLRPYCRHIMAIDDLANRPHDCDLLLDQNLGRKADDYEDLIPEKCNILVGPEYAMLREEFSLLRGYSIERRKYTKLEHLLITMGGVDNINMTYKVLKALSQSKLPSNCKITVVMGKYAPWLNQIQDYVQDMPYSTSIQVNVKNMANLMVESDAVICAGGSTVWECCTLALPMFITKIADNQTKIVQELTRIEAAYFIGDSKTSISKLKFHLHHLNNVKNLDKLSNNSVNICDGMGVKKILNKLLNNP